MLTPAPDTKPHVPIADDIERYYSASQMQLVWSRFKRKRSAMASLYFLLFFILIGLFSPFLPLPLPPALAPALPWPFCQGAGLGWIRPLGQGVEHLPSRKF